MSILMNTLRRALAGAPEEPQAEPREEPDAPAADEPPAWRLLGEQTGVQDLQYGDIARPAMHRMFAHPPRRLLDIGCASGAVGAGLKQDIPGLWAWGCELNADAARVAASRLDHVTTLPRAQWSPEDIARVGSIDTVLLLDVLEHMYNPWAELEFLAQRLPPGAQVIVSLPNVGHISILEALSLGTFPYRPLGILDVTHVRFFTFDGMQEMFAQTGFRVDETWILNKSPNVAIERFPARVATGKMMIDVDSQEHWERLNAIQFGFRLRKDGDSRG
jgi:2-polyprenyl-3-methyl-5-hydroxy-6-metoxy-1,4-benzoquinol methylase